MIVAMLLGLLVFVALLAADLLWDRALVREARRWRAEDADLREDARFSRLDQWGPSAHAITWGLFEWLPAELERRVRVQRALDIGTVLVSAALFGSGVAWGPGAADNALGEATVFWAFAALSGALLLWSYRRGKMMGRGWVERSETPGLFLTCFAINCLMLAALVLAGAYVSIAWPSPP